MKRIIAVMLFCFMLCGCSSAAVEMDSALSLRQKILSANICSFDAKVTADYAEEVYTFTLRCTADSNGNVSFSVTEPETIAGISGSITDAGGNFSFEDTVLAFETLAVDSVSPVIAPWLFLRSLRSGYISHCSDTDSGIVIDIDDTYRGTNLHTEIFLDREGLPEGAEMYYDGRRILTVSVANFVIL